MLPKKFVAVVESFANEQIDRYNGPRLLFELATRQAKALAQELDANPEIVYVGALLMDCQLGRAIALQKQAEHITMAVAEAEKLFKRFPELETSTKQNLIACIKEHHGARNFTTLEAEICCNADCYKFASVEGAFLAIRSLRAMPPEALIKILADKLEEKWQALSLDVCRKELEPQYKLLKEFLKYLPG